MDTSDKVREIIKEKLGLESSQVFDEANIMIDLGADSLDCVEIIMEFEKKFSIAIPDEDAEKILTVGDAIRYLEGKVK